jgi:WD40 repeat protein
LKDNEIKGKSTLQEIFSLQEVLKSSKKYDLSGIAKDPLLTAIDCKSSNKILLGDSSGGIYLLSKNSEDKEENYSLLNSTYKSSFDKSNRILTKSITDISFMPINPMFFGASSSNAKAGVFGYSDKLNELYLVYPITNHTQTVTGIDFHPFTEYCILSSEDKSYSFHNTVRVSHHI